MLDVLDGVKMYVYYTYCNCIVPRMNIRCTLLEENTQPSIRMILTLHKLQTIKSMKILHNV